MGDATSERRTFGSFSIPFRPTIPTPPRSGSIDSSLLDIKRKQRDSTTNSRLRKSLDFGSDVKNQSTNKHGTKTRKSLERTHKDFPVVSVSQAWERDKQTGEVVDHTDMLHSLVDQDRLDPSAHDYLRASQPAQPGSEILSKLPKPLWITVLDYLTPTEAASLALSCKDFLNLLGMEPLKALSHPDNHRHKVNFLVHMDRFLPGHLLCFPCGIYHVRTQAGKEMLQPTNISNPLFDCPNVFNPKKGVSRTRITFGRTLPFTFVQLALRAHHHSPDHGIHVNSLSRRYKDRDSTWSHQTRFTIVKDHLLMRVTSTCFAAPALPPAGLRHLLYSREDFTPYFSVCAHWRDGELMPLVKCALSHIPKPVDGGGLKRVVDEAKYHLRRPSAIVVLCGDCRPIRRCPECPTEYLIEMKMAEDKSDPINIFKQALVVTRWSDLGDGSSPWSPEWAACNGEAEFDSLKAIGKRAISGVFEAEFNGDLLPGQRILSMNPKGEKLGENGHRWY